jgi:hypothetical protein
MAVACARRSPNTKTRLSGLTAEELVVVLLALAVGGLVKGLTGMGLPLVSVPVLAGYFGVEHAVLVMVIPSLTLNAYQVWTHRAAAAAVPELPRLIAAGVPGAVLGATVLHFASERALATALAVWLAAYVLMRLLHPTLTMTARLRRNMAPVAGLAAGALQAATGISAPVVAAYFDALGLEPTAYVFAVCAAFGAFAAAHFATVAVARLYTPEIVVQSLIALVPAIALTPVGVKLRGRMSKRLFDVLIRSTLLVMAARLVYSAWLVD